MMKRLARGLHYKGLRFDRNLRRGQKGFTLIELLVVVAILGVLAAVAIPNIASFMNKGTEEAKATELSNVQTAVIAMMADAEEPNLDGEYTNVQDHDSVVGVAAGSGSYTLDKYILGFGDDSNLSQPYDIGQDGAVKVHAEAAPPES